MNEEPVALAQFHFALRRGGEPEGYFVARAEVREALSTVGGATVVLHGAPHGAAPLDVVALLGQPATLHFDASGARSYHGIVTAARYEVRDGVPTCEVDLSPRLWRASRSRRSRVYLDVTAHDLARRVLAENGFEESDWSWRCAAPTPRRAYVAQYEETDLDFLHRTLEREGIFYAIVHDDARDRVVFGDDNGAFSPLEELDGAVAFAPLGGGARGGVGVRAWRRVATLQPRAVAVRDYQPEAPRVVMNHRLAPVMPDRWTVAESGLQSHYGDHVAHDADATRVAKLRAELLRCEIDAYEGTSQVTAMRAGGHFALHDHPDAQFDREYLVVRATHRYELDRHGAAAANAAPAPRYDNELRAIPRAVTFRPARATPRPVMPPWIPGVIDDPSGDASEMTSPLDERGCYRVVLPFDTSAVSGQVASCPIPLAQGFAGHGFGQHHPLHRGTHVLIGHLHGDPDRPVIVGALMPSVMQLPTSRGVTVTRGGVCVEYEDHGPGWKNAFERERDDAAKST